MATKGGAYSICDYYIAESGNEYIFGGRKCEYELSLLPFIEKEAKGILYHKSQSMKREGLLPNSCHRQVLKNNIKSTSFPEPILNPSSNCNWIMVIPLKTHKYQ